MVNHFPSPHHSASSPPPSAVFHPVYTTTGWLLALCLPGQPSALKATTSLSLAFFTFWVCLWIPPDVTSYLQRSCKRQKPTPGITSAQSEDHTVVGSGLVCKDPAPARPRESLALPNAIMLTVFVISKRLKSSPSLLRAGSPSNLPYVQTCWSFSKVSSGHLCQTSVPGWEIILVNGLLKMQLVTLIGSARCLHLVLVKWACLFLSEICGIICLLSFLRKGCRKEQVDACSPRAAELSC